MNGAPRRLPVEAGRYPDVSHDVPANRVQYALLAMAAAVADFKATGQPPTTTQEIAMRDDNPMSDTFRGRYGLPEPVDLSDLQRLQVAENERCAAKRAADPPQAAEKAAP